MGTQKLIPEKFYGAIFRHALLASFIMSFFTTTVGTLDAQASMFDGEMNSPGSIYPLLSESRPITVELGLEYSHSNLTSIDNIVVENPSTSTAVSGPVKGNVDSDYPDTIAQTLKLQALLDADHEWTLGVKTYLPLDGIAQLDTGNEYQPEYVLYRANAQRPRILLTSGINLNPDWRIGFGLDVGFSVNAEADVFLQSGDGTVSDQRISAKVKPGFVPQASLAYKQYQFTVRGENKAEFDLTTNAGARVFSDVSAGIDFSYTTQSAQFYQPWEFEFDGRNDLSNSVAIKYGVTYELWTGFQAPAAVIQTGNVTCPTGVTDCTSQFSSGLTPGYKTRNIWVPEVGFVFKSGDNFFDVDYRFKDSIFNSVPTGVGNYLDPPRHDFLFGFTHPTPAGWQWNIHMTVSRLTSQTVVKSDPDSIGGPGYTADGWLYGGGFSVAIPFKD
jgi:hypothetical protein